MVKKIFLVLAIAFISVFPLLHKGLPPTHDGEYHVIRAYEFNKTLQDGTLYPRWAPDLNNGFGAPLFNYVYPLPNYVASLMHLFGFSFIDSFKFNMFIASLIGAVFFYLWARKFWGNLGAIVSSAFFSFSPYHLLDIYIRGSVGEVWALSILPGFLWAITEFKNGKPLFGVLSSVFLALLIFSHNILAFMFFFLCLGYTFLIFGLKIKSLVKIFYVFILGIGLASVFWLPAITENGFVRGLEIYDYSSNFPEFYQLLIPSWGSGFSGGDLQNQLSFQIGIGNLLVVFLSIVFFFKRNLKTKKIIIFFLMVFFIVFFLMLKMSEPIWKIIPFFNYFQFPWRFLSVEVIVCSFLAGSLLFWKKNIISILLIFLTISLGLGYANFAYYHQRNDNYYLTRSNFIEGTNSPGNTFNTIWANNLIKQKEKVISKNGAVSNLKLQSTKYTFDISSKEKQKIIINTAYFPNWSAYVDGRPVKISIEKEGNFGFTVPSGNHNILVKFEDTMIRKIASVISLVSLMVILLNLLRFVRIKR